MVSLIGTTEEGTTKKVKIIMKENPVNATVCAKCDSRIFILQEVHMISNDNRTGQYTSMVSTTLWKCGVCNTYVKEAKPNKFGRIHTARQSIISGINADSISIPTSDIVDLNIINGTRKPLLRRAGGLSNLGLGTLPSTGDTTTPDTSTTATTTDTTADTTTVEEPVAPPTTSKPKRKSSKKSTSTSAKQPTSTGS